MLKIITRKVLSTMMTFTEHLREVSFFLFLKMPYYHDWTSNFVSKINSCLSMNKGKNHQESKNSELHIFKTQTLCRVERNSERKKIPVSWPNEQVRVCLQNKNFLWMASRKKVHVQPRRQTKYCEFCKK